ncbi:hypothetical protein MITS9509_03111 [Synechococcus sp. MIT S9509]|uniref:hypothetical protein n=1 Tax=unclassified Synechococcus TaxID=2626047 RepID=UPI0007BAF10B|nr:MULTISPECIES: hypothetical protein [unclassified Synechococcus]KZR83991.1 hypothetical protein MITS9504_03164 [Synechococcus sp. MIT S9504]KZR89042.1 hypothetical protein MITS9509_03111 [Synechococcus sp. MIT S9509]
MIDPISWHVLSDEIEQAKKLHLTLDVNQEVRNFYCRAYFDGLETDHGNVHACLLKTISRDQ